MSLQLQNHMGFRFWSSWGVVEQISKTPSRRGLQKYHAQLLFFELENDKVQKVSILFSHVHLFLVVSQLRNIPGLVNKSLMGSKFGFENFGSLVQKPPRGEAFFHLTSL